MGKIILGSSSPRRSDILKNMKLDFEIIPSSYVEKHDKTDFSYYFVENLAYNKELAVAKEITYEAKVIGADTIVVIDNKILGKPQNYNAALKMLNLLSGKTHFVVTSVAVVNTKDLSFKIKSDTTYVTFEKLTNEQIENYIKDYKPYDKAGAYGIQELPKGFIKNVEGAIDNVIGLPSKIVAELLSN